MKKLFSILLVTILVTSFVIGAIVQSKPVVVGECSEACNRTTYQLIECCTYQLPNGEEMTKCKMIGWCYPE